MPDIKGKWSFTQLPPAIRILFQGMPGVWRHRHQLIFCWLIVMQIVTSGARTLTGLSQSAPNFITEWRFRRLLSAGYWSLTVLLHWFAEEAIKSLPVPENQVLYVIADGSKKDKRGSKNPAAQKGRLNQHHSWFFGIKFIVLMVAWEDYRIPVDFQLVLPKGHPDYQKENALFRQMLSHFQPPDWAKAVIVVGDAAFAAKDNMTLIQARDQADSQRRWGFVFAIARTWNMADGKSLRNLVKHTPHSCYRRTWIPRLPGHQGRKTFCIFEKRTCLKHLGDVTVVLTKKGRNVGPAKTKLLVTNLLELKARQVIDIYQRRWAVGVSRQGRIIKSVQVRPRLKDSRPRSWEGAVARKQDGEALRQPFSQGGGATLQVVTCSERRRSLVTRIPVAETVYNVRRQQEMTAMSRRRFLSPAGYQRRHGTKDYAATGEALGARRRNLDEGFLPITVSGKWQEWHQGGGSGRSTVDLCAAKRTGRKGPGPVDTPLWQGEAGVR